MSSTPAEHVQSWLKKLLNRDSANNPGQTKEQAEVPAKLSNPVEKFYRHRARKNLPDFYRFALQSRSIDIRDYFANAASDASLSLTDLLTMIATEDCVKDSETRKVELSGIFNIDVLLALADLLANSARDDLDVYSAVRVYDFVADVFGVQSFQPENKLLYVETLNEVRRFKESASLAEEFEINKIAPLQTELLDLRQIQLTEPETEVWLKALNDLYSSLNLTQIDTLPGNSLPLMDRLTSRSMPRDPGPKVSVIMPTYSPGPGIRTAIRGLLEQTWTNLEIIVVDDASPLEYMNVFSELELLDSRIRVLHQEENMGSYVARNAGLAVATGDFITTHDDDDWSHPDKISEQMSAMLDDSGIKATVSAHIRTTQDLAFRRVNMHAKFLQMNYSSLMFPKTVIEEIGDWDTVNRGGDSEFYLRLIEYFGEQSVVHLLDKPLSFSRVWEGSLTSGEMWRGYFAYPRLLYRWAFRQWQWERKRQGKKTNKTETEGRPYAVPTTFEAGARNLDLGEFDVIYITDFFRQARYVNFVLDEMKSLLEDDLRIGFMHINSPRTIKPAGFPKELFELQRVGKITQVSEADFARTRLLIVYDTSIGMFLDEMKSKVRTESSLVIERTLPTLAGADEMNATAIIDALRNLDTRFNSRFQIIGATPKDDLALRQSVPIDRLSQLDDIWTTHVRGQPQKVNASSVKPALGFHSFGNRYRWPNTTELFERVYDQKEYDVFLYGHVEVPLSQYGSSALEGIRLWSYDEYSKAEFFREIDFWAYFPHTRLLDQVWEPVLEAMQAGKVVILPAQLRNIYGDAAVYSTVDALSSVVKEMVADEIEYRKQVEKGQTFVERYFSVSTLLNRVSKLL